MVFRPGAPGPSSRAVEDVLMKARYAVAGLALSVMALLASAPALAQTDTTTTTTGSSTTTTRKVGGDSRFFMRFVEDAGIVPSYWLEGKASYQSNSPAFDEDIAGGGESDLLSVTPVF